MDIMGGDGAKIEGEWVDVVVLCEWGWKECSL